ncbi:sodium/potassium-transporting ATPase subunit beta-1-interacting protein 1-like isoform X2 [Convolutriloba macropyga]|uniref:sodium/potassium-transporting ATPase subunit beta-1-interacting protein 1-like isoform X2 n=1 Tax=Convolutriloba macropyga TaxID=536237 RepID=UPI003F5289C6
MACCTARCTLVSICIFQLVFVLERTVFDALGHMYGLVVADGFQILMIFVGVIGTYCYKPKYLVPYGTMQFLWLGWNAYLICYYLEAGMLQRKEMWAWPLTLSFDSQDYFDQKLLTCNTTSPTASAAVNGGEQIGYTIDSSDPTKPDPVQMYHLLMYRDPNCLIRPLWFKLLQCALQVIFSFFAMLYVCYIVYGYEEDDDCFDFIGGFDNYNPGYPEPHQQMGGGGGGGAQPKHYSGGGGYSAVPTASAPMAPMHSNQMIMQPLPGMHPQVMDGRGDMYADSRA